MSSELAKRVNKWRKVILPKIDEEENRKNFDIHDYGSFVSIFFSLLFVLRYGVSLSAKR